MTALVYIVGAVALLSAIGVVTAPQTIYCALSLVGNMVSLAVLFLLLNAQFLAAVQVIIYAGAVMVLFVFIIALLNPGRDDRVRGDGTKVFIGFVTLAYVTVQVYALATNGTTYDKTSPAHPLHAVQVASRLHPAGDPALQFSVDAVNKNGNVQTVATQLFTTFLLPFEITSLLLFVAAIGAVYLTRGRRAH